MDLLFKNFPYFMQTYFNFDILLFGKLVGICLLVCMCIILLHNKGHKKTKKYMICDMGVSLLLAIYFACVIGITLMNQNRINTRQIILNPWVEFQGLFGKLRVHCLRGMISNMIMFFPLGIFVIYFFKKHTFLWSILMGMICSVLIEVLQYVFQRGVSETSDVIFNVLGAVFGSLLGKMLISLMRRL